MPSNRRPTPVRRYLSWCRQAYAGLAQPSRRFCSDRGELRGLAGVDPSTEDGNVLLRPCLVAGHRAIFQSLEDVLRVLCNILVLPKVELCDVEHRPSIAVSKQGANVAVEATSALLSGRFHVASVLPLGCRLQTRDLLDSVTGVGSDPTGSSGLKQAPWLQPSPSRLSSLAWTSPSPDAPLMPAKEEESPGDPLFAEALGRWRRATTRRRRRA